MFSVSLVTLFWCLVSYSPTVSWPFSLVGLFSEQDRTHYIMCFMFFFMFKNNGSWLWIHLGSVHSLFLLSLHLQLHSKATGATAALSQGASFTAQYSIFMFTRMLRQSFKNVPLFSGIAVNSARAKIRSSHSVLVSTADSTVYSSEGNTGCFVRMHRWSSRIYYLRISAMRWRRTQIISHHHTLVRQMTAR